MRLQDLLLVASLAPAVLADVQFLTPAAGQNVAVGPMKITWKDSGVAPAIDDLSTFQIQLMVGGQTDTDSTALTVLVSQGDFATDPDGATGTTFASTLAGATKNGFYLKMTSTAKEGGTVINYSSRFNVPGMTGITPAGSIAGAAGVSGTDGPDTVNQVANVAAPAAAAGGVAGAPEYSVPYALQTGLTKYAPMQKVPPTKISLNNVTPQHSTSAYTIATTWLPKPTVLTTLTESQTFSVQPIENTAAAQANPTDEMAKFLARWKD